MSAYPLIAYPLEVVKTNRIIGMQTATLESTEELSRDLLKLAERKHLSHGLFRGALPILPICLLECNRLKPNRGLAGVDDMWMGFSLYTLLMHPFSVLQTKK